MRRRTFLQRLLALPLIPAAWTFTQKSNAVPAKALPAKGPSTVCWADSKNATPIADLESLRDMQAAHAGVRDFCRVLEVDGKLWYALPERPLQTGIEGKTYFKADEYDTFNCVHGGRHLYLDGKDVHHSTFEADLRAGWIGVYEWRFTGQRWDGSIPLKKIWLYGTLAML